METRAELHFSWVSGSCCSYLHGGCSSLLPLPGVIAKIGWTFNIN